MHWTDKQIIHWQSVSSSVIKFFFFCFFACLMALLIGKLLSLTMDTCIPMVDTTVWSLCDSLDMEMLQYERLDKHKLIETL